MTSAADGTRTRTAATVERKPWTLSNKLAVGGAVTAALFFPLMFAAVLFVGAAGEAE